jgi:hypothetical protein
MVFFQATARPTGPAARLEEKGVFAFARMADELL